VSRAKGGSPSPTRSRPTRKAQRVGARTFERQAGRSKRPSRSPEHRPRLERWLERGWPSPREALRRIPTAARLCALVACLNAVAWSLITPPFQVPDEPEHVAYVKDLAETGHLPTSKGTNESSFSLEETVALRELRLQTVAEEPENQPISTSAQQRRLERELTASERQSTPGSPYAGVAAAQPPLYYALQSIPYTIGKAGTLLDRIQLMRLLSALMAALTAMFTWLFVREALPGAPWAWTVGGLGVALAPLLGFMSGAVNPDSMLYAVTAAVFYCLARAFRRGLQRRSAIVLGAVIATGFATKLNFVGIAPGALLGLIVLSVQAARRLGPAAYVSLALALAIALSPPLLYVVVHLAEGGKPLGIISTASDVHGSLLVVLSYVWQLFLPRLPGMHDYFAGVSTTQQIWFKGYVGLFGWLDTTFPGWVYEVALIPALAIAGLCVSSLVAGAGALRARAVELGVYAVMCVGLLGLIGVDSYLAFARVGAEYGQVRYVLPLLPILGLVLTLAARGAGRRWGPAVGAAILVLFLVHDVVGQLQTIARFYG
jgi:hypothetical protein